MGPIDRALKLLSKLLPDDFVAFLYPERRLHVLEALDKEVPASTRIGDKAWRVQDEDHIYLLHVEFAVKVSPEVVRTLFVTAARLHDAYVLPVASMLVALSEEDAMAEIPDSYGWSAGARERCRYQVDIARMWDYDSREALESDSPVAWLLASHMRGGQNRATLERAARQILELPGIPSASRADLLAVLRVLSERQLGEMARALITRELLMESTLFQEIFQDGRDKGLEEGIEKGELEGQRKAVHRVLIKRFRRIPRPLVDRLALLDSLPLAEEVFEIALDAPTLTDFEQRLSELLSE